MHGVVVICFSLYMAVDDRVLQRVIIGYRVFEENCVNNKCTLKPFRERGQLGNDPTVSRVDMGRGSLPHRRE